PPRRGPPLARRSRPPGEAGGAPRVCPGPDLLGEHLVDTGAAGRDVVTVDVDGDRRTVAGVLHQVDVLLRRHQHRDAARRVAVLTVLGQELLGAVGDQVVAHLAFGALQHADDAPTPVVVDRGALAGQPDQGDDRVRAVVVDVDDVLGVTLPRPLTVLVLQEVRLGQ